MNTNKNVSISVNLQNNSYWITACTCTGSYFEVHLTPKFFLLKILHVLVTIYKKKLFDFVKSSIFYTPVEVRKIAAILAHDRVSRVKGLVTTVASLLEHDNLYFAPFRIAYLFMFGRLDRYWSQIAEICHTDMSLEVAVM